jgi:hypothetical protein
VGICIEVLSERINLMVMVFMNIRMVMCSRENGGWEKEMGEGSLKGLMDICKLVHGVMINFKFDFFLLYDYLNFIIFFFFVFLKIISYCFSLIID